MALESFQKRARCLFHQQLWGMGGKCLTLQLQESKYPKTVQLASSHVFERKRKEKGKEKKRKEKKREEKKRKEKKRKITQAVKALPTSIKEKRIPRDKAPSCGAAGGLELFLGPGVLTVFDSIWQYLISARWTDLCSGADESDDPWKSWSWALPHMPFLFLGFVVVMGTHGSSKLRHLPFLN
eukprot:1162059-Pelagomonas_calceolata.AAC.2